MPESRMCFVCTEERPVTDFYSTGRQPRSECKKCSDAKIQRISNANEPRVCTDCNEQRAPSEFYVDRGRLAAKCKGCTKEAQRLYNQRKGKVVRERYRATAARGVAVGKYNKSQKAQAARARWRESAKECVEYRLIEAHRSTMKSAMQCYGNGQKKDDHTILLLGCSIADFRNYIEKQWQVGMTWDSRGVGQGKWQIDHITPLASFDLTKPDEQKRAFHFSNQQPLWHSDNAKKSDKLPDGSRGRLLRRCKV